jgi:amino acid adenylation domain-containing protein
MSIDTTPAISDPATVEPPHHPLSFGQEQLWFLDQLAPGETTYNIAIAWRLHGQLDVGILQRCLDLIVARHEILRVTVRTVDGAPVQVVSPPGPVELLRTDLRGNADPEAELDAVIDAQLLLPFDLERGPLYRYRLMQLGDQDYVFCQSFHHLVSDGWSSAVMNADITAAYRDFYYGREPSLSPVAASFLDFATRQRERLSDAALTEELDFWAAKLADLPVLELPTDRPRPVGGNHRGASYITTLPVDLRGLIQQLADDHGASMFMVIAAAYNVVLSRYSGQEDIPIGVPMLGRVEPELESVVGLFTNMTVLRSDLTGDPTFSELLDRTADWNLELYEHQEVSFNQVVDRVQPIRDPDRNPLFGNGIQLLSGATSGDNLELPGVQVEYLLLPSAHSRFDSVFNIIDDGHRLRASIEYSSDLFDRWRIAAMVEHVESVLRAAAAAPNQPISRIPLVSPAETEQLLAAGHGEVVDYNQQPLHDAVARVAAATPDAIAVVCKGVELSYAELDRRADRLARRLRSLGLRSQQVVAVVLERDLAAYVTMLGILKAGGTFAMLDYKHPASRLAFMIDDTAAPIVISSTNLLDRLPESTGWQRLLIDAEWDAIEAEPATEPLVEWADADSLAYILYTSGSTGAPKGVMIAHRAVSLFCEGFRRTYDFGPQDRLLQLPSLSFDMSQGELWTAWLHGATVVAVSPEEGASPEGLATLMREQRVSYAGLPPAMQSVIDAEDYPDLKYVMGGAEVLPPELVNKWNQPGRSYVNLYGPTEAAIACTEYRCPHQQWTVSPPIGRPQVNRQVYVVDRSLNLVPRGVAGELLVGGEPGGLAAGYLNQPELTAEKFITDPFKPTGMVYRTGDLVRWNQDLQLEFIGRVDNQIKLRGLRIELGEIEAALMRHPAVGRAVVLVRPDQAGEKRLIGYVTPAVGADPEPAQLREFLADALPEYMIPTAWLVLAEFPLIAGWKIDRKALPDPDEEADSTGEYVAPRTETEELVAKIYAEVLAVEQVGAEDSFFDIGGNSLQAMRVVSRINKGFGIKISIRMLYGGATVGAVAAAIDEKKAAR